VKWLVVLGMVAIEPIILLLGVALVLTVAAALA